MALATRELELIIIAKDRASAVLARIGGAMVVLGGGAARAGAEAVGFFAEATGEAIEFRRQIALAFTQLEISGATFDEVLALVRQSARNTSVPLEELAATTYDIFSTLTLDSLEEGQALLDAFAQSAVAGQAPIQDIGRATIAWLNALGEAPTLENAQRILDVQFELVRKGAGTYSEFAEVIGKAIPPFVAANQGVEELGGTLAFLTRNGLSAAEAATSASRGIELLYSAKAITGLGKIGISVEDANGEFRNMDDLLADVVQHFQGLSDAERRIEFKEIFGTGYIQARRFFDLLIEEGNFEEFLFLLGEVRGSVGEVANAFDIMSAEPAVQLEAMRNRWQVLRQEIGDALIPLLTQKLLPLLDRLLDWWEDLDEIQRTNLVKWGAFAALFLTIGGAIASFVGALVLFFGLMSAFTGSIGAALAIGGSLAGVITGLAGAIAYAIIDWDGFVERFGGWWETAIDLIKPVTDWLTEKIPAVGTLFEDLAAIWERLPAAWDQLTHIWRGMDFGNEIDDLPLWFQNLVFFVGDAGVALQNFWNGAVNIWENVVRPAWDGFTTFFSERWAVIRQAAETVYENLDKFAPLVQSIAERVGPLLGQLSELFRAALEAIITIISTSLGLIAFIWEHWGDNIVTQLTIIWEAIAQIIGGALDLITGILQVFVGLFTGDWDKMWEGIKNIASGAANTIIAIPRFILRSFVNMISSLGTTIATAWTSFWKKLKDDAKSMAANIIQSVSGVAGWIWRLSPWNRSSPSLVQEVTTGLREVSTQYAHQLAGIRKMTSKAIPTIQASLNAPPSFATAGAGFSAFNPQPISSPRIDTSIDRQINIDKVISQANAFDIASEIAWREMNS